MCWWKSILVRALVMGLLFACAGLARGETILRLEPAQKKAAVKPKKNSFSVRGLPAGDDWEFEGYARFLLGGKKEQPPVHIASSKKKALEPAIEWGDKHAKKVNLKGLKIKVARKPVRSEPPHDVSAQWAVAPTPMAASSMHMAQSVPTPKAVWAGLGMIGALGLWRWLAARRIAGD